MGNRIAKHVYDDLGAWKKSTYYVRDASGNVMAVYENTVATEDSQYAIDLKVSERHIYGSSRVGMDNTEFQFIGWDPQMQPLSETTADRVLGFKAYELSNHLGNVLSVITDTKIPVDFDNNLIVESYTAVVISATDYSPFGVGLYGRSWSEESYRYGFQNQEEDKELWEGAVNYKYRVEDPRLGRFFSVDPLTKKFPFLTSYQFAGNKPIWSAELEGLESEVDAKEIAAEQPLQVDPGDEQKIDQPSGTSCFGETDWSLSDMTIYTTNEFTTNSDCVYFFSDNTTLKQGETGWVKSEDGTLVLKSLIIVVEGEVGGALGGMLKLGETAGRFAGLTIGLTSDITLDDLIMQEEIMYTYREVVQWYGAVQYDQRRDEIVAVDYYGHQVTQVIVSAVYVDRIINEKTGEVICTFDPCSVPMLPADPSKAAAPSPPFPLHDVGTIEADR